jgi:hypothetical protein
MTIEERLDTLEQELSQTKRRSRWLSVAFMLAMAGLVTLWTMQAQGQATKVLRANAFILEDENGKERGRLHHTVMGPALELNDENGLAACWLWPPVQAGRCWSYMTVLVWSGR